MSDLGTATSAVSLSEQMRFDKLKSVSPAALSRRVEVNSESSNTYSTTGAQTINIYFSIPSQANAFINVNSSYLEFEMYSGANCYLDGGLAGSVIRRLEITAGGNQIEDIDNYNVLNAMLYDLTLSVDNRQNLQSALQNASTTEVKEGAILPTTEQTKCRVSTPLISSVLGGLSSRYFPAFADSGIRLKLVIEAPNYCLVNTAAVDNAMTIINPKLLLEYSILDANIQQEMMALTGGIYRVPSASWAGTEKTMNDGTAQTISLPFRYSSCKNLLCGMRAQGWTAQDQASIVGRSVNRCQSYQFRQGAFNYPSSIVNCLDADFAAPDNQQGGEALMEALKSLHAANDVNAEVSFDQVGFLQEGLGPLGSFVMATELEGESHVSNSLHSGVSSLDSNWYLDFKAWNTPNSDHTLNAFVLYDVIYLVNAHTGQITRSY